MSDRRSVAAVAWWRRLQPNFADGTRNPQGDRAALAKLRRCASVTEAMQEPATMELFRDLGFTHPDDLPAAALAAAVLASVREIGPPFPSFARAIGPSDMTAPETALVKPLRFRRLIEADTHDERLLAFRRAVALLGGPVPINSLAEALLDWSAARRQRWIFDYWNATERPTRPDPSQNSIQGSAP